MSEHSRDHDIQAAVDAAKAVMHAHIRALNAGDEAALAATLHSPHYRLSGGVLNIWQGPESYLADFHSTPGLATAGITVPGMRWT